MQIIFSDGVIRAGVYSKNNLPKIKDKNESIRTHCITMYIKVSHDLTYFYSFGVEHIQKEFKNFKGNKNIITNNYRIQAHDSITCEYFCIGFIDFMLKSTFLLKNTKRMIK